MKPIFPQIFKNSLEIFFLLPLILFVLFFILIPIILTLLVAFTSPQTGSLSAINFINLFFDRDFKFALGNTFILAYLLVFVEILIGLVLALIVIYNKKAGDFFKSIFILPLLISPIVAAAVFKLLLSSAVLRDFLSAFFLRFDLSITQGLWVNFMFICLADAWKTSPLVMLIIIAGVGSIDRSVFKQARSDGATTWQLFKSITMPVLMPYLLAAVILRLIDTFRIFIFTMALLPRGTQVISTFSFYSFKLFADPFTAASSAAVLTLIVAVVIWILMKTSLKDILLKSE